MPNLVQSTAWGLSRLEGPTEYPSVAAAPYPPDVAFPEFSALAIGQTPNPIFALVRETLRDLGLDSAHYGTPQWNPLGDLVKPGGKIVVKPNWVLHKNMGTGGMDCMITHPSVLRAVIEYVFLAKPSQVTLGDAPLQGCDFERMLDHADMRSVIAAFQSRGLPLVVKDFRRTVMSEQNGIKTVGEDLRPESDYVLVDLGSDSMLEPISKDWKKFRVTVYDPRKMWEHHRPGRHRFLLAKEILEADLVVNVPKLKVHKKAGITCCLKNLIGINGNKEYLPHHRKGALAGGSGDNYGKSSWLLLVLETALDFINRYRDIPWFYRLGEIFIYGGMRIYHKIDPSAQIEGSWHGNDTIWRTCLDLNRALLYADKNGNMQETLQREEISIADAIITGQGEGPLAPDPLNTGAIFAVHNPAIGDHLGAHLLGLDPKKIPLLRDSATPKRYPILPALPAPFSTPPFPPATPPKGWTGHVEVTPKF